MDNNTILQNLEQLLKQLKSNTLYTEYTANEGRRDATRAISHLRNWKTENSDIEINNLINITILELETAIKSANEFYDDYDFTKRKSKSFSHNAFESVIIAQGAIEKFVHYVKENIF